MPDRHPALIDQYRERGTVNTLYGDHLAAEGIEPFLLSRERRALALGATSLLAVTMKVVLQALREATDE